LLISVILENEKNKPLSVKLPKAIVIDEFDKQHQAR